MSLDEFTPGEIAGLDRELADGKQEMILTVDAVRQQLLVDVGADPTRMLIWLIREFYAIDKTKLTMLLVHALVRLAEMPEPPADPSIGIVGIEQ